jgi:hypothetical protein
MSGYSTYINKGDGLEYVDFKAPQLTKSFNYSDLDFLKKVEEGIKIASKSKGYANQTSYAQAMRDFYKFNNNSTVVTHNGDAFDHRLMGALPAGVKTFDTMAAAKQMFSRGTSTRGFSVTDTAEALKIKPEDINKIMKSGARHTAGADAELTAQIAKIMQAKGAGEFSAKELVSGKSRFRANSWFGRNNPLSFTTTGGKKEIDTSKFGGTLLNEGTTYKYSGLTPSIDGGSGFHLNFDNEETGETSSIYFKSAEEAGRFLNTTFQTVKKTAPVDVENMFSNYWLPGSWTTREGRIKQMAKFGAMGKNAASAIKKLRGY